MLIKYKDKNMEIEINPQLLTTKVLEAQKKLNMQITADCTPYIPFKQGQLRSQVRYPDGLSGGTIEWYAPYAHYMYEGYVYGDPKSKAGGIYTEGYGWWSRPGIKKVKTDKTFQYSQPGTGDHWFERAKKERLPIWINVVERTMKGGGK